MGGLDEVPISEVRYSDTLLKGIDATCSDSLLLEAIAGDGEPDAFAGDGEPDTFAGPTKAALVCVVIFDDETGPRYGVIVGSILALVILEFSTTSDI